MIFGSVCSGIEAASVARLPGAYYPERWGGYVPRREGV